VVYNGALYLGVINLDEGAGVWRTTGENGSWEQVGGQGLGDPGNLGLELIPFSGHLYAWTSNYARGQGVLRTACSVCQRVSITGPGRYDFPALGASLDLRTENLESIEVCQYPQAPLPDLPADNQAAGYYRISPNPRSAVFSAGLTLTNPAQTGSRMAGAQLVHWTGQRWSVCQPLPGYDGSEAQVRCPRADNFSSPWGIVQSEALAVQRPTTTASGPLPGLLGLAILGLLALGGGRAGDI
jgi:hypothetical protein